MIYFYFSILELSGSSSSTVSMQSLRLLINLSTNQHMIEYLQSAEVSLGFPILLSFSSSKCCWNVLTQSYSEKMLKNAKIMFVWVLLQD